MQTRRVLFVITLLACALRLDAAGPDDTERRIAAWVDVHAAEAVPLIQRAVEIDSGTMSHAGVRAMGKLFEAELLELGFTTRWIEMPAQMQRAGHLFAERRGGRGKRLLLIGHLDTVFEKESPFHGFRREGDAAYGPGTVDMKGGDAVIVYALRALQAAGALDGAQIVVALTGDEENTGTPLELARRDLIEAARRSDLALGFEAGTRNAGTVARRGASGWQLKVTARPAHSSRIFDEGAGAGAIFEAARILEACYAQLRGERYLTFNPGVILGGTAVEYDAEANRGTAFGKTNVIAETAVVHGDLRFISEEQKQRARERMRGIAALSLPGAHAELVFHDSYPALSPTPANYALLSKLDRVSQDLGFGKVEPLDPGERGAGDVSFAGAHVEAALDGLGAVGGGGHTVEEHVDLAALPMMIKRAALLIYRLTR